MAYHRLLEALAEPGCPVCALRAAAAHRYLESLLYENVNDVGLRGTLAQSRGFCAEHAWELVGFADSLGTAILYKDQAARALEDVRGARGGVRSKRRASAADAARVIRQRRTSEVPCPACRIADEATARYLAALIQHIDSPDIRAAIEGSSFLCLPDAVRALEAVRGPHQAAAILDIMEAKLAALEADLSELIRKRDYRFANEPKGREQTSWVRAVGQLVGWRPGRRRER